ncbi:hypothetical protein [Planotetraspora mira]|uniref:Uncharacterized protein n=1 Tax=Planotetraspora mira TaxID=58121 RepID=A0A8J3TLD5_9ACTN|nr:hypothetical protein [Planotetraspora mira]GII28254.1 hypothetical protein Pmi06nite_16960 [Planotetraspora mira]
MGKDDIADIARWLWREVDPGDWSGEVLRPLAEGRGRLVPVQEHERRYAGDREYRGLVVPISLDGEPAAAFRRHAGAVEEAIGAADSVGSHGPIGPWYERSPDWGAPFLRWRRPGAESLELRAAETGAELSLQPTEPYEEWRQAAFEWGEPSQLPGGFVIEYLDAANEGLSTPGGWRVPRWTALPALLSAFLRTLPAETYAIGRNVGVTAFGGSREIIAIRSAERLTVEGWFNYFSPGEGLGWSQRVERTRRSWTFDAGGPGDVDGDWLARHLVEVLKTEKVSSVAKLGKHVHRLENAHTVLLGLGF